MNQPNNNTPAGSATHAVLRKTPFIREGIPTEEHTYLAAGTADECAALVDALGDFSAVFGWDTENPGQIGAPTEQVIPMESVPAWASSRVLESSAAEMLHHQYRPPGGSLKAYRNAGLKFAPEPGEGTLLVFEA